MQTFIFFLYRLLQFLGFPFILLYLVKKYGRTLPERYGGLPFEVTAPGGIWLHAVSVGEVLSAVELLRELRERYPDTPVYVSTTTATGRKTAEEKLDWLVDGVFYTPLDFRFSVRRVLRALRPSLVVILETEIWPNLWREARRSGARLIVVNGRISDRALPRYQRFAFLFRHVLTLPHRLLVQSAQDAERYRALGAEQAVDNGNLKYDFDPAHIETAPEIAEFVEALRPAKVLVVASTHCHEGVDEDDLVLAAWPSFVEPGLLMILVPRQPARFDAVAEKLKTAGIAFTRRSALGPLTLPGVLLLDSVGELSGVYRLADAVVMGGTYAPRGGHNILEPALFGKPVLAGPSMENFAEIAAAFTAGGALLRSADPTAIRQLLAAPGDLGPRAQKLAEARRGAVCRTLAVLSEEMEKAWPVRVQPFPLWVVMAPLGQAWAWGARWNRARTVAQKLNTPVVSIGGIGMGGTGKTPTVLHLARHFANPAILTRGYKRLLAEDVTVVPRGSTMPIQRTGDEAQIFVRSGVAHVGIGSDRFAVGRAMEDGLHPELFLLDDGFQHHKLARNFDLVLLDALDPFAGDAPFPLGRQRETPEVLSKANAILLTRTERGRTYGALQQRLGGRKVYRSRVVGKTWVDAATGEPRELGGERVAAFCGLANPATFWTSLRGLGVQPLFRWTFGDHHHYRHEELVRLREHAKQHRAELLLTTEKDVMNLPADFAEALNPVSVAWLRIDVTIEDEDLLIAEIKSSFPAALL